MKFEKILKRFGHGLHNIAEHGFDGRVADIKRVKKIRADQVEPDKPVRQRPDGPCQRDDILGKISRIVSSSTPMIFDVKLIKGINRKKIWFNAMGLPMVIRFLIGLDGCFDRYEYAIIPPRLYPIHEISLDRLCEQTKSTTAGASKLMRSL